MNKNNRGSKRSIVRWIILFAILIFINFYQLPYYFTVPGDAKVLSDVIEVEEKHEYEGSFMLTTVRMGRANVVNYVWAMFSDQREIIPEHHIRPEGETDEQYQHRQMMMMAGSQDLAVIVAYSHAGKNAYFENHGVLVTSIISGMDAEEKLKMGDRIIAIDDKQILETDTLFDLLGDYAIGDIVDITVEREGVVHEYTLEVNPFPEELDPEGERGGIGIANPVTDRELVRDPEVTIDTAKIGGPSAGLMFSLEIYNQLVEEDITKGHHIAGTGSINEDGKVGRIGGVSQKVVASDQAGASLFFVPYEGGSTGSNYDIARQTADSIETDMEIVPVDSFEQALQYLIDLEPTS
ncbi:PDZ domain-containing protein [Bacillus shivajii]|uniref:SepM family pheromone-processing serine protease n=1 Tax=Bacillus shivajii TaxID=1983719 RepID=UPI001CFBE33A|nr:SepM family pheromone-processing serine protease [Bacillus shivajii]UCZ51844.1 PDZ domain-containing protein [Bacillus shivajii]